MWVLLWASTVKIARTPTTFILLSAPTKRKKNYECIYKSSEGSSNVN